MADHKRSRESAAATTIDDDDDGDNNELCSAISDGETSFDGNNNTGSQSSEPQQPTGSSSQTTSTTSPSNEASAIGTTATNIRALIESLPSVFLPFERSPLSWTVSLEDTQKQRQQQHLRRSGLRVSESNVSESDDWHLLEVDERSISSASSSSLSTHQEKLITSDSSSGDCTAREQQQDQQHAHRARIMSQPETDAAITSQRPHHRDSNNNASKTKYLDIEPPNRDKLSPRLIYICTIIYSLLPLASLTAFLAILCLLFTNYWPITVLYFSYLIFDCKTCNQGGRRWTFVYKAKFWSYLAAYFPIKLRYSQNFSLNPNENYILNYHPHGISAFGCVSAFATNGLNFANLFPGIRSIFMVHETSFLVPVMRETFMLRGDCSVNSKSFDYILSKRWQQSPASGAGGPLQARSSRNQPGISGNLLALCGGGLAEADLSDMNDLKIVCANRKGFVKKALIHGAHLIPCIAFGENSVFKKVNMKPGSLMYRFEKTWYSLFKFKHPIYYGHSLMFGAKGRGPVPYKRPITVLMGDPIRVERIEEPSQKQIDELHAKYIHNLRSMYEDNKAQLCTSYDTKLLVV